MRYIIFIFFLTLSLPVFSQVGGAGTCHVAGNPNSVSAMETQDMVSGCLTAMDTTSGTLYRYNRTLSAGSRWVQVGADTQVLSIDSTGRVFTISLTDGGSVSFEDLDAQTLSISNDTLTISNGNSVVLPSATALSECMYSITQTTHAFSSLTPIYWTGSQWASLVGVYGDSIVADLVVIDSLDADTFTAASCGNYTTALTDGDYFQIDTGTGYQAGSGDTTTVILFSAKDGKLIVNPILGFAAGGDGGSGGGGTQTLSISGDTLSISGGNSVILPTSGTGVTSVATGFGLTGGTITTTGTISADSAFVATLYALQDTASAIRADFPTGGATNLTFSGASSPVTLESDTGTDVTFAAGTNITLSQSAGTMTINASGGGMADPGSNGVLVRTALNTTTARTITGTANRITVTDGNGVSGNPTLDIGTDVVTLTGTQTLTDKRITRRDESTASSATPTINTDNTDIYRITAQTEAITSMTTNLSGTPTAGQRITICITGTASRAITWGASFEASSIALPTTTSGTDMLCAEFIWNTTTSKWRITGWY